MLKGGGGGGGRTSFGVLKVGRKDFPPCLEGGGGGRGGNKFRTDDFPIL